MGLATEDKNLTEPAARLALALPNEWKSFIDAFERYATEQLIKMTTADLPELARAQGRAQLAAALLGTLSHAVQDANKAADRKSLAQQRSGPATKAYGM